MKFIILSLFTISSFSSFSQHPNITIGNKNNPCEPSIAINPNNTNQLMAGSVLANCYASTDGGLTWKESKLTSKYGVYGDPVLVADYQNAFYFFHLSNPKKGEGNWVDRTVCQKTLDMGQSWILDSFSGLNDAKVQDKHWVAVNSKTNAIYTTWTEFDGYESKIPTDSSRILFTKSMDGGETWTKPNKINEISGNCLDSDSTVEGAVPCVGLNGEIYVSWAGPAGLRFDKSLDEGVTWMNEDILVNEMPEGWAFDIEGISRANGMPITACDLSGGNHNGTIYINWCDQRNGEKNTDVWLSKSTDGGKNWDNPTKVNNDSTNRQQFFTWMTIDQTTGKLWFIYYDRRNYTDTKTDVFMAMSDDGGNTFTNFKISDTPFTPNTEIFFGDYNNVTAHKDVVRPIWTRLENKKLSIHTAIVDVDYVNEIKSKTILPISNISIKETSKNKKGKICFDVLIKDSYSIKITNEKNTILKEIVKQKNFKKGTNYLKYNSNEIMALKGIYKICFYDKNDTKITGKQFVVIN
jgi:hypothetical protein